MRAKRSFASFLLALGGFGKKKRYSIVFSSLPNEPRSSVYNRSRKAQASASQPNEKTTRLGGFRLVAEVGFEPHDLRVMSPTSYQAALLRDMRFAPDGAGNRDRTGTILSYHGILSPGRLPVPPHRQNCPPGNLRPFSVRIVYYITLCPVCQPLFEISFFFSCVFSVFLKIGECSIKSIPRFL